MKNLSYGQQQKVRFILKTSHEYNPTLDSDEVRQAVLDQLDIPEHHGHVTPNGSTNRGFDWAEVFHRSKNSTILMRTQSNGRAYIVVTIDRKTYWVYSNFMSDALGQIVNMIGQVLLEPRTYTVTTTFEVQAKDETEADCLARNTQISDTPYEVELL